ncbi:MAG: hypothetical protein ACE5KW_00315 [Dehalococcoidia bacterium]
METGLKEALRRFVEEKAVEGRVHKAGQELDVKLFYRYHENEPEFEIAGLGPEIPANIRFRAQLVEACIDGGDWETIDEGDDLQVFMMLDPRVFYPIAERAKRQQAGTFSLVYRLADLHLSISQKLQHLPSSQDELLQYFRTQYSTLPEEEQRAVQPWFMLVTRSREAEFHLSDGRLSEMVLRELPPFEHSHLAVQFIY